MYIQSLFLYRERTSVVQDNMSLNINIYLDACAQQNLDFQGQNLYLHIIYCDSHHTWQTVEYCEMEMTLWLLVGR